ncbi:hypothetical protein H5410_041127 [Solanum commersonii]|uniref:Uncharacterized protein n=1 Tax=Solanum commersonii TaxID=4109 RepID=A0A9J5XS50_SOLCO|nr:hypothetical protein H5410_041127 [Solanum commersonii]
MAKHFEQLVAMDERFEITAPRNFSMVCFRVSLLALQKKLKFVDEDQVNKFNAKLLESINSSGNIHMTHTVVGGVHMIRFAIGAPLTDYRNINIAWDVIQNHVNVMLKSHWSAHSCGWPVILSITPENFPSLPFKHSTKPQDLTKDQAVSQLGAYANLLKPLHNNASIENKRPNVEPIPIKNVTYIDGKFSYGWPDLEDLRIQIPKQLNVKGDVLL